MTERRRKTRVLLADDSSVVRMGLSLALRTADDIEIVGEAGTGQQAVEMAGRLHPDLILMDVSLPELDGIEATRRIHAACPGLPIVGLTMYTDVAQRMLDAGAVDCLDKALGSRALVAAVRERATARGQDA